MGRIFLFSLLLATGMTAMPTIAEETMVENDIDSIISDAADYWTNQADPSPVTLPTFDYDHGDDSKGVTQTQMLAPQRRSPRLLQRQYRRTPTSYSAGIASVPYMIGDTGSGTCLSIGGLSTFSIDHPTLTCSRLNVSENNSPIPTDRSYISYRHFKNITGARVITFFESDFNVDRLTLGTERTFMEGLGSIEIRLPLARRLSSSLSSFADSVSTTPAVIEPFIGGRQNELGNVSALLKLLLIEKEQLVLSGGVGLTVPTARDFSYDYFLNNTFFLDTDGDPGTPADLIREMEDFGLQIDNEIVYMSPFLSWVWQPHPRFFHQGFLQIETALNPTTARVGGAGQIDFVDTTDPMNPAFIPLISAFTPPQGRTTKIHAQTLMRLNLGCGYICSENPRARWIKRLAGLFEIHYTTTLQDAKFSTIPLDVDPPALAGLLDDFFTFGNFLNRTDIVNVVAGVTANVGRDGRTVVTNGIALPVTSGNERAFDLEYNLQLQRIY